jgi:glycosyltransferase involved in cell wall biosynthesis
MANPPPGVRALIVMHDPDPNGAGLAIFRCARLLVDRGWEVAFWIPGPGWAADSARSMSDHVWIRGRPIRYSLRGMREPPGLARRLVASPAYLRDFGRMLRRLRPALVHANTFYCLPEAAAARALGVPVVLHAHEILANEPKDRTILACVGWAADRVIAVSEACASPLVSRSAGRKVSVIPNGVPRATAPAAPSDPPIVGTVGVVSKRKGTDLFLEMARLVAAVRPDVRFMALGGDGPGPDAPFAERMHRIASTMAPTIDVTIRRSEHVMEELGAWTTFVLPARQDPFPLAVLEAMAAGLPVVAARVGGIPEQITQEQTGLLVPPEEPRVLADAVLGLLADAGRRRAMGRAAADRASTEFALERQADSIERVWVATIGKTSRRGAHG